MVAFLPLLSSTALAFYSPPTAYALGFRRSAIVRMDEVGVAEPAATEVDTTTKGVVVPTKSGDGLPAIGAVNRFPDEYADLFKSAAMKSAPPSSGGAMSDEKGMMQKVKDAGAAGIISYIFWEWAFWGVSVPVALFGFQAATGYWPDFSDQDDLAKLGAEAFAFVNVARFAVPLRISLALGTTPWVRDNIVSKIEFLQDKKDKK